MTTLLSKKKSLLLTCLLLMLAGLSPIYAQTCPANQNLLVNGGFDDAGGPGVTYGQQPGWVQTGPGNDGLFETWNNVPETPAQNGTNFIELNVNDLGIISQTVSVVPGKPLDFSYYHQGRVTLDEMVRVEFVDPATGAVISSIESTGGDAEWSKISTSVVPPGNSLTIRFVSLNGSLGENSLGNWIDNVTLNYAACDCTKPHAITGASDVCSGSTVTLSSPDCAGTVTWSNGQTGATIAAGPGTYTSTCTINGCVSPPSLPVTVTEQPPSAPPSLAVGPTQCPSGNATITATGCNGNVTWSTGATGASVTVPAGTYSATCTPANGCPSQEAFIIVPPYASPCPTTGNLLVNGSFEQPVINIPVKYQTEPGWTESGVGNLGFLEAWTAKEGIVPKEGRQFIELNAFNTFGILSQTINVEPNVPLNFSFYHAARMPGYAGEKLVVEFIDSTGTIITSVKSTANSKTWVKVSTSFVSPTSKLTVKFRGLTGGAASATWLGSPVIGNMVDAVEVVYAGCVCPCIPTAPVVTASDSVISKCQPKTITLTATGCDGGTLKWNTGATGTSITTTTQGTYTAQCVLPGTDCASPASSPLIVTMPPDLQVSCPVVALIANGGITVRYTVKNNGTAPATGKDTIVINGENRSIGSFTNLAQGDSVVINYTQNFLACGSTATVVVKAAAPGVTDVCPADNTCTTTQLIRCFPPVVAVGPPGPIDPNYKVVSPMRNLEGGIFPSDEWLTYTIHCQNDGLGICHNAIMVDTIDTSKLMLSTLQIVSSWDSVQLTHINANTVSFDFIGVGLTSSTNDLPNSQTEVTFKIKRRPDQPVGTEIYNMAGVYFDTNHVVNTNYAASKIIEPCPASQVSTGAVNADITVEAGTNVSKTFTVSGYNGLVTGWEVSTDPNFNSNVEHIYNITDSLVFNDTINVPTYIRALVQTGGCAITGSKAAVIHINCNNLLKNGSFENPALPSVTWTFKTMPGWTNTVDNNTMELHRNYLATATDGVQYVELNGYNWGNIYQDLTMAAGSSISWKLDHKARTYSNEVIKVTLSAPDGSNAQTVNHTGSLSAWQNVNGNYQLAPTQTAVRLRISGSGGTSGIGNFIDNVSIKYQTCGGTTAMKENNENVAVSQLQNEEVALKVHPNPVHTITDVDLKGFENGTVSLHILNATGQMVKSFKVQYTQGTAISINLAELKAGIYLIKAGQDDKTATAKVVKN